MSDEKGITAELPTQGDATGAASKRHVSNDGESAVETSLGTPPQRAYSDLRERSDVTVAEVLHEDATAGDAHDQTDQKTMSAHEYAQVIRDNNCVQARLCHLAGQDFPVYGIADWRHARNAVTIRIGGQPQKSHRSYE